MASGAPVTCVGERDFYGTVSVDALDDKAVERREAERAVMADVLREIDVVPGWPVAAVPPAPADAPERTLALDLIKWEVQELEPVDPLGKLIEYSYKLHVQWTAAIYYGPRGSRFESSAGETPLVKELHKHGVAEGEGWARTAQLATKLARDDARVKAFDALAQELFDKECPEHCGKRIIAYTFEEPSAESSTSDVVGLFDGRARMKWRLHIHCQPALLFQFGKPGVSPADAVIKRK